MINAPRPHGGDQDGQQDNGAVLVETESLDAKRFACRILGELGNDDCVQALEAQFENDEMYDVAVWALVQIETLNSLNAIIRGVKKFEGRKKLSMIVALGFNPEEALR